MDIHFIDIDAQQPDSLTAHIVQTHKMFKCTYKCECLYVFQNIIIQILLKQASILALTYEIVYSMEFYKTP